MEKTNGRNKIRRFVLSSIILFSILELAFVKWLFPESFTVDLLYIPAYFFILGISVLFVLSRADRKKIHPGRAVARLMLFNVAQITISFILLFCYYYFSPVKDYTILIAFCIFYIFFMGLKFYILYNIDKQHKKEKERQNETK